METIYHGGTHDPRNACPGEEIPDSRAYAFFGNVGIRGILQCPLIATGAEACSSLPFLGRGPQGPLFHDGVGRSFRFSCWHCVCVLLGCLCLV